MKTRKVKTLETLTLESQEKKSSQSADEAGAQVCEVSGETVSALPVVEKQKVVKVTKVIL